VISREENLLINPRPKNPGTQQYRDLVHKNEWLQRNVYDTVGKN